MKQSFYNRLTFNIKGWDRSGLATFVYDLVNSLPGSFKALMTFRIFSENILFLAGGLACLRDCQFSYNNPSKG